MTVICLPDQHAAELTGPLPDGLELVFWDDGAPQRADEIRFVVPPSGAHVPEGFFERLTALDVVQLQSAGADAWVDQVPERVTLCDARGVHGGSTSEWVLTATLAVLRDIPAFVRAQERREWSTHTTDELQDKRVLIIGAGDLGTQAKRRFEAFDATVTLAARHRREGVHAMDEVPDLLPDADVVVVVVPLTPATTGLIDGAFLARMADGALIVNASRGPVADADALLSELRTGRLRAALDVTDPEPLPSDHELWALPNVLITPHVGGNVLGFPARAYHLVAEQLSRFAAGQDLENVVSEGY